MPLISYYGLEYRLNLPNITSLQYIQAKPNDDDNNTYTKFIFDGDIHDVVMDDDMKLSVSFNPKWDILWDNNPYTLQKNNENWIKWANSNKSISKYKVNIQTKPYPYSPDDELVNIESTFGIDKTPKDKRAPKRKLPLTDTTNLRNQQEKRRRIYS